MKSSGTFCCVFQYQTVGRGNQHGGGEYDDLQNWPDMTSHENPRFSFRYDYAEIAIYTVFILKHFFPQDPQFEPHAGIQNGAGSGISLIEGFHDAVRTYTRMTLPRSLVSFWYCAVLRKTTKPAVTFDLLYSKI